MNIPLRFERRTPGTGVAERVRHALVRVLAIFAGLVVGAILVEASGNSWYEAFSAMLTGSVGTVDSIEATLLRATPLILTGLAVSLALRMQLWNIGGEGQLLIGATAAGAVGFALPDAPAAILVPCMMLAACVGGALWAQIAAVPKARIGLNEIIVTLFLNYVALRLVSWLVFGPWKDAGAIGFAYSRPMPDQSRTGSVLGTGVTVGIFVAIVVVLMAGWVFNRTSWGFTVDITGGNQRAAAYLGFSAKKHVLLVFAVSGAIAGLAGCLQLLGPTGRLQPDLASGYGYAGILVAFLAGRSLGGVVVGGVLFAALTQGGFALQATGVPSALATVIQALVILFVLVGTAASAYRLRWVRTTQLHGTPGPLPVEKVVA